MLLVETRIKRKLSGFSRKSPEKPSYKFHSIGSLLADLNKAYDLKVRLDSRCAYRLIKTIKRIKTKVSQRVSLINWKFKSFLL